MPNGTSSSARWPGLEAQVAAIADDIAYDNHDIDDGLRAGLLILDELVDAADRRAAVGRDRRAPSGHFDREAPARAGPRHDRHDGRRRPRRDRAPRRAMLASRRSTTSAPPAGRWPASRKRSATEERDAQALPLRAALRSRRSSSRSAGGGARRRRPRRRLSRRSRRCCRQDWQRGGDPLEQLRTIGDFIAGMTDRFAIARHEELVGPVNLPAARI